MRVLVCPDKFKGTLTATQAAAAMRTGVLRARPNADVTLVPMADGGEGTLNALRDLEIDTVDVSGPVGRRVTARVGRTRGDVWLEAADMCGLGLEGASAAASLAATTYGVGEALAGLARAGERRVTLAVGGTASTDGGTGAAAACGWRFLDTSGRDVPGGGGALLSLSAVVPPRKALGLDLTVVCDVTDPLLGSTGSARRYAPQKGAGPEETAILEMGLERLREVVERDTGFDMDEVPHGGAGGGLAAGCAAFLGGRPVPGAELIAHRVGLERLVAQSDIVFTGEGRVDESTLAGKAPAVVASLCARHRVPCLLIAGRVDLDPVAVSAAGFAAWSASTDRPDPEAALIATTAELIAAALA